MFLTEGEMKPTKNSLTADASVEVQRYPSASYLPRGDNPLDYRTQHATIFSHLFHLVKT